jgi:hypothetical protein
MTIKKPLNTKLIKPKSLKSAIKPKIVKKKLLKNINSTKPDPVKKKEPRGASEKILKLLSKKRKHVIKELGCRNQCNISLGNIKCDGSLNCYLCDTPLIPHKDVFNKCKNNPKSIWKIKSVFDSKEGYYPDCEHVMPCASIGFLNAWETNFMIYIYLKNMLKKENIEPILDITTINPSKFISHSMNYNKKKAYFLNIIIRMNYSWAHKICNITKTDKELVNYNSGLTKPYKIDNTAISNLIKIIFEDASKYHEKIKINLSSLLKSNQPIIKEKHPFLSQQQKSIISVKNRLNYILYNLNIPLNIFNPRDFVLQGGSNEDDLINKIKKLIDLILESIKIEITLKEIIYKLKQISDEILSKINRIDKNNLDNCFIFIKFIYEKKDLLEKIEYLKTLNELLDIYLPENLNKYDLKLLEDIKKNENTDEYSFFLKFLSFEFSSLKDENDFNDYVCSKFIKKYKLKDDEINCSIFLEENFISYFDKEKIYDDLYKYFIFNISENDTKILYENLKKTTSFKRIIYDLYIFFYFDILFKEKLNITPKLDYYKICLLYFRLSIMYGLLYYKKEGDICKNETDLYSSDKKSSKIEYNSEPIPKIYYTSNSKLSKIEYNSEPIPKIKYTSDKLINPIPIKKTSSDKKISKIQYNNKPIPNKKISKIQYNSEPIPNKKISKIQYNSEPIPIKKTSSNKKISKIQYNSEPILIKKTSSDKKIK